jgi:hypothetical protein
MRRRIATLKHRPNPFGVVLQHVPREGCLKAGFDKQLDNSQHTA